MTTSFQEKFFGLIFRFLEFSHSNREDYWMINMKNTMKKTNCVGVISNTTNFLLQFYEILKSFQQIFSEIDFLFTSNFSSNLVTRPWNLGFLHPFQFTWLLFITQRCNYVFFNPHIIWCHSNRRIAQMKLNCENYHESVVLRCRHKLSPSLNKHFFTNTSRHLACEKHMELERIH